MSDGTAAPFAHPRPPPQPLRNGTAAELLPVPAAAEAPAGSVPRSNLSAAETAALLAPVQSRRPG